MKRLADLIGKHDPIVTSMLLRSRGTHPLYQARIGAETRAAANRLCNQIRGAGAACIVTRVHEQRSTLRKSAAAANRHSRPSAPSPFARLRSLTVLPKSRRRTARCRPLHPSTTSYADMLARVRDRRPRPLAPGADLSRVRGRAAERPDPWRYGDQRRDGAGEGRRQEAARAGRGDRGDAARRRR